MPPLSQVQLLPGRENRVDDDVFHLWNHVLLDVDLEVPVLFVQKGLELWKGNGIADLVLAECRLVLDLQAVVGEVDHNVLIVDVVFTTGGPQIALVEKVDVEMGRVVGNVEKGPHPDVKLPLLVDQRPLYVFLYHPVRVRELLFHEGVDVSELREELDALSLVQPLWLHDPLVVLAVLARNVLGRAQAFAYVDVREALFEGLPVVGLCLAEDEGCRYDVEHLHQIFLPDQVSDFTLNLLLVMWGSLVVDLDGAKRPLVGAVGLVLRYLLQLLL